MAIILVARHLYRDVLQVVRARAFDDDLFFAAIWLVRMSL